MGVRARRIVVGTYVNFLDHHSYHWYLGGFDPAATSL